MQICLSKRGPALSNLIAAATIIIRGRLIASNTQASAMSPSLAIHYPSRDALQWNGPVDDLLLAHVSHFQSAHIACRWAGRV